jgi:Ca2+-binding EF-hand superfamily protein
VPHLSEVEQGSGKANPRDLTVDFDTFSRILNRPGGFRDPGEPEEYCRGFQVFDKDMTGFIGVGQLRYSTFSLGEYIPATAGRSANTFLPCSSHKSRGEDVGR